MNKILMVLDVESVGLYGEPFAVGFVVINSLSRTVLDQCYLACPDSKAQGTDEDRRWIQKNVLPFLPPPNLDTPREVREVFWNLYRRIVDAYKNQDFSIWADCGYPVEDRFLRLCVQDDLSNRVWKAPYPLHEIATVRAALRLDSVLGYDLPDDKRHNPLEECQYIAPKLIL
jgi:hypothetical protein